MTMKHLNLEKPLKYHNKVLCYFSCLNRWFFRCIAKVTFLHLNVIGRDVRGHMTNSLEVKRSR